MEESKKTSKNELAKTRTSEAEQKYGHTLDYPATKWYQRWKRATAHPDLRVDQFHNIDTKDKAYWLGFLYSDGTIFKKGTGIGIQIELSRKDEETIDRFCEFLGLDKNRKRHRIREKTERVLISFACKMISDDLMNYGLKFRKSKIIEYPKLSRRDLELAFLLGYFDGDGKEGTTRLFSGSKRFLKQVKKRFDLRFKIQVSRRESKLNGRKIKGSEYYMHLGAELFNEMMESYKDSMQRKRWHPCNPEEKRLRSQQASSMEQIRRKRLLQRDWRKITKDELEELVWQIPLERISEI